MSKQSDNCDPHISDSDSDEENEEPQINIIKEEHNYAKWIIPIIISTLLIVILLGNLSTA